jgi:DNA-directed RNA polymerase subunit E'/Rpb7
MENTNDDTETSNNIKTKMDTNNSNLMTPSMKTENDMSNKSQSGGRVIFSYDQLFNKSILTKKIGISVGDLMRNIDKDVTDILKNKVKVSYEGLCIKEGYVKYNSVVVLAYSMGMMKNDYFEYNVVFECMICEPFIGLNVKCEVKNITKAGIRGVVAELPTNENNRVEKSPFVIFIARDYYYDNETFNKVKEQDIINVSIIGSRYELNDEYIVVFAELIDEQ